MVQKTKGGFCSMKKLLVTLLSIVTLIIVFSVSIFANTISYTVVRGDSLWKIAVKYQVGLSEIKSANPQIANYDLIYPGQIINIPETDKTVTEYEKEVVRLVNIERTSKPYRCTRH